MRCYFYESVGLFEGVSGHAIANIFIFFAQFLCGITGRIPTHLCCSGDATTTTVATDTHHRAHIS